VLLPGMSGPSGTNIVREIVDESDVYVDVHKAIRRLTPAPRARHAHPEATSARKLNDSALLEGIAEDSNGNTLLVGSLGAHSDTGIDPPKTAIFMKRRSSAGPDGVLHADPVPIKASLEEMKRQLRLHPANMASNPLHTRKDVFKIKQGLGTLAQDGRIPVRPDVSRIRSENDESTPLLGRVPNHGR
jgi:metal transporter CNNM